MIRVKARRDAAGEHKIELYAHVNGEVRHVALTTRDPELAARVTLDLARLAKED